jgi:phage shock protein A
MDVFDLDKEFKNAGNKDELAIKIAQLQEEMKQESEKDDQIIEQRVDAERELFETISHEERLAIKEDIASGEYNLYPIQEQQNSSVLEDVKPVSHDDAMTKLKELRRKSQELSDANSSYSNSGFSNIKEKSKGLLGKIGFKK